MCHRHTIRCRVRRHGHPVPGYTLIELMLVLAILATLTAVAMPAFSTYVNKVRITRAIPDVKGIAATLDAHKVDTNGLPQSLREIGYGNRLDPWGHPYQYLNIATTKGKGSVRKDKSLVPINDDYDLYSLGPDGRSQPPLTAKVSRDDIVRANNGAYVGVAEKY